jgi:hypothetical protein
MAAPPANLGIVLGDDVLIYRAFAEKKYRNRDKNAVRYFAYVLRDIDVNDGLSVGLSPAAAVRGLQTNEGYCQILVGVIHALPFGLQVRLDLNEADHAYICNLPLMTISDANRERAMQIGNELARKSTVVTCDPFVPNPAPAANEPH